MESVNLIFFFILIRHFSFVGVAEGSWNWNLKKEDTKRSLARVRVEIMYCANESLFWVSGDQRRGLRGIKLRGRRRRCDEKKIKRRARDFVIDHYNFNHHVPNSISLRKFHHHHHHTSPVICSLLLAWDLIVWHGPRRWINKKSQRKKRRDKTKRGLSCKAKKNDPLGISWLY